jgi:hypothetical protein
MIHRTILHVALASALLIGGTAPVFAQGYLDRMKEDAQRRAENKAVMDAENPPPAKKTDAPAAPATASATAPAPAASAPAEPAPATAATPAPAPAQ